MSTYTTLDDFAAAAKTVLAKQHAAVENTAVEMYDDDTLCVAWSTKASTDALGLLGLGHEYRAYVWDDGSGLRAELERDGQQFSTGWPIMVTRSLGLGAEKEFIELARVFG